MVKKKVLLPVIIFAGSVTGVLSGMGSDTIYANNKEKEKIIIMCDSTETACVIVVVPEANILLEQGEDVISRVGLSPEDLISVSIEPEVEKNMPKLWKLVPEWCHSKLKGAIVIRHKGKIRLRKSTH